MHAATTPSSTEHPTDHHDALTRRQFLRGSSLASLSAMLGASIPFGRFLPLGLVPVALAETDPSQVLAGKPGLVVLGDRPINIETPAHLLDDDVTPVERLFVRNNGDPPDVTDLDADSWKVEIGGESCLKPGPITLGQLKARFRHHSLRLQIECAGNGRSEFQPPATGNQWTTGAVGCPEWTGVRLRDVLDDFGVGDDAVYVAYEGADRHLSGDPSKVGS